jgi:hypothetical protein
MNRKQRRIQAAGQRRFNKAMERDRADGMVRVAMEDIEELLRAQRMLVAIVKSQGRVRLRKEELESLSQGDSVKSARDGDALVLTYTAAPVEAVPAEGAPG